MEPASARLETDGPACAVERDEQERALAARVAAGDVSAFAALLKAYWEPLVRYAGRKLASHDAAEDVVQQAFVRLWENRGKLNARVSPRGYLYRICHNLAVDELRKRKVRHVRNTRVPPEPAEPPTPDQEMEADELAAAAARAIEALPERRRDVFVLGHFHGLSYKQIGKVLGITPRTVANHMTLALGELRQALRYLTNHNLGPD